MTAMNLLCIVVASMSFADLPKFEITEIETGLQVGYAVRIADVNNDGRPDVIVLDSKRVIWYESPAWTPHVVLEGRTPPDNVCMAPLDVNGDGRLDLAIGAGWQGPQNYTHNLFWLEQTDPGVPWRLHQIGTSPTVHRMQWMNVVGDPRPDLVVVPLFGAGKTPAERQANPVTIMAFEIPNDPARGRWHDHVLSRDVHVSHNFLFRQLPDVGTEMVVASFEGLTGYRKKAGQWTGDRIVEGDQQSKPNKGCSEVAEGRRRSGVRMFATIEPWHGNRVVVYTPTADARGWKRSIVDDELQWGHAVAWADLDGDGNDELVAGVRDDKSPEHRRGVRLYSFLDDAVLDKTERLDPGGVAVEDLTVGDLDGDGRPDLVASGRQTKNVRIYWNKGR
jgi:hypothetical protein